MDLFSHIKKFKKAYISGFVIVAVFEASISYTQFIYGGMQFLEELHFIYSLCAIFATLSLAALVADRVMNHNLFKKIDNASYYIYLIHPLSIFIIDGLMAKYQITDIATGFIIRSITTYILSITISVGYMETKKKIKRNRICQSLRKQG